jgi:hypothetical protein
MTRRRIAALAAAFALAAASSLGVTMPAAADDDSAGSSLTRTGTGPFAGLEITVSQTRNLIDQVVPITWKGGARTAPGSGQFAINYLQIMQCWGDDSDGPSREQCQYGGLTGDLRGGAFTASRQVSYGSSLVDPEETLKPPAGTFKQAFVPFRSVTGKTEDGSISEFFDANTTNEVPYAVSREDGTGQDFFPVQTVRDAPGLGCGEPVTRSGKTTGRSCWLVIVPRNDREVDGSVRTITTSNQLASSPLSASNWKHRIVFPLEFEPLGQPCPLGREERLTVGQENVAEAIVRWQPALCADGGPVYGYSQVSDDGARRQLVGNDPTLSFISQPVPSADRDPDNPVLYAPVAVSGIGIGFNVESQSPFRAPPEIKARDGQRITDMTLTPRLVAKLITQSYSRAADIDAPSVQGNPSDLTQDPEFKALNPQFDDLRLSLPEALLPAGRSDVAELLWIWLEQDKDAREFLAGKADPWGMTLNATFKGTEVPRNDYPKTETYCREYLDGRPPLCTLDAHPYVADMKDGAKSAARGDTQARSLWDPVAVPPAWKKGPAQPSGNRAILAITDTASAERFSLEMAKVKNASGAFVAPTATAMGAAVKALKADPVTGVRAPNPSVKDSKAYPLTTITYAATAPTRIDADARKDYARLLSYAAGPGQQLGVAPGQLPFGYAPLPANLVADTKAAAAALLKGPATADPDAGGGTSGGGGIPTTGGTGEVPFPEVPPGEEFPSDGVPPADPGQAGGGAGGGTASLTLASSTPLEIGGVGRLIPAAALLLGLLAAVAGPVLLRLSNRGWA